MSDIVKRLRERADDIYIGEVIEPHEMHEAADAIEELVGALEAFMRSKTIGDDVHAQELARVALKKAGVK